MKLKVQVVEYENDKQLNNAIKALIDISKLSKCNIEQVKDRHYRDVFMIDFHNLNNYEVCLRLNILSSFFAIDQRFIHELIGC